MAVAGLIDIGTLVTSTPGVYGGRPCLAGTRYPVNHIALHYNAGASPEWMAEEFGLRLALVHAGIAFYLANREAIDVAIEQDRDEYQVLYEGHRTGGSSLVQ